MEPEQLKTLGPWGLAALIIIKMALDELREWKRGKDREKDRKENTETREAFQSMHDRDSRMRDRDKRAELLTILANLSPQGQRKVEQIFREQEEDSPGLCEEGLCEEDGDA
jgi:hypothetical protein